jgi:hypothetical protein
MADPQRPKVHTLGSFLSYCRRLRVATDIAMRRVAVAKRSIQRAKLWHQQKIFCLSYQCSALDVVWIDRCKIAKVPDREGSYLMIVFGRVSPKHSQRRLITSAGHVSSQSSGNARVRISEGVRGGQSCRVLSLRSLAWHSAEGDHEVCLCVA